LSGLLQRVRAKQKNQLKTHDFTKVEQSVYAKKKKNKGEGGKLMIRVVRPLVVGVILSHRNRKRIKRGGVPEKDRGSASCTYRGELFREME